MIFFCETKHQVSRCVVNMKLFCLDPNLKRIQKEEAAYKGRGNIILHNKYINIVDERDMVMFQQAYITCHLNFYTKIPVTSPFPFLHDIYIMVFMFTN